MIYSRAKDGGLGIQNLAKVIPAMQAKRIWRLLRSEDKVIYEIAWQGKGHTGLRNAWLKAGGKLEDTPMVERILT